MAFPYIHESNFEVGTNAEWTSESDSATRLDFPHYTETAGVGVLPFRGAYCMRVRLGSATAAKVIDTDIDIADGATRYVRFYLYIGGDVAFTADDTIQIAEFTQAGGGTVECAIGLKFTAATDLIEIGIGDGTAPTDFSAVALVRNRWYCIEAEVLIHTTDAGTLKLYVDGVQRVSLTGLDNAAAVGDGTLGVVGCLTTTTGYLYFDQYVFDDTRVYPIVDRYATNLWLTKSGHAFVGAGYLDNISLVSGAAADNTLTVYDTERANTNDAFKTAVYISNTVASAVDDVAGLPVQLKRGCYVALTGTNPRAACIIRPNNYSRSSLLGTAGGRKKNPLEVL